MLSLNSHYLRNYVKHNMKAEKAMQQKRFLQSKRQNIGMMSYADKENFMKK